MGYLSGLVAFIAFAQSVDICDGLDAEVSYPGKVGGPQPGDGSYLPGGPWLQEAQDVELNGERLCARLRRSDDSFGELSCRIVVGGQLFQNLDGILTPTAVNPELYQAWTSTSTGSDGYLPPGTWRDSARNARMEGNTVFAELHKEDGTWVPRWTTLIGWQYLRNVDGEFFLAEAPCTMVGLCPNGYLLVKEPLATFCQKVICDMAVDRDHCCDKKAPCLDVENCWTRFQKVPDLLGFCADTVCDQVADAGHCCVGSTFCNTTVCAAGYAQKSNADSIRCPNSFCMPEDNDLCCDKKGKCSTLGLSHSDCSVGDYLEGEADCGSKVCDAAADLAGCCRPSMDCEQGLNCTLGFLDRPSMASIFCDAAECTPSKVDGFGFVQPQDLDVCCFRAAPCANLICPGGERGARGDYFQKPNTFCDGTSCVAARDQSTCCFPSAPCTDLVGRECPYGSWFNESSTCTTDLCVESTDRPVCCFPSRPCGEFDCGHGFVHKLDFLTRFCDSYFCNTTIDREECCGVAAHCDTLSCPFAYAHDPLANDTYCGGTTCTVARDRDTCCTLAPSCATSYTCPHGYVPSTGLYCLGWQCEADRDLDTCCLPAKSCEVVTCPTNYVLRPDTYCLGTTYIESRDLFHCCERGMALQYYKFVTIDLRLEGYNVFQIADLEMSYSGKPLVFNLGNDGCIGQSCPLDVDTAYSIDGDAPDKELPQNILDMNLETKWLDYKKSPAIIRLAKKKPIHNYRLRTANDEAIRDPVLWNLQGSPDYVNWVIMHEVANRTLGEALVPLNRSTWSTNFTIEIPCYAPTQAFIPNSPNITCQEGDILRSGSNCTTLCNDGFTPSIRTLLCKRAQLYPDSFYNCIAD